MADIYLEIEDYLWFAEYQQGNVNVVGLIFDDLVEESFDLGHEAYVVWTDQIEETLGIEEAFTPYHFPSVGDTIVFAELFGGSPIRVKQSVLNLVYTKPIMPVKVAHMHLDIIMSGSDTFMEEVSDELQIHSSYANAVPYYWDTIFESFNIEMAEPQPYPPFYLKLLLSVADLVNMRQEVTQDYLFNSYCLEELFIWEEITWGWDKLIVESLVNTEAIQEIIGKLADDYLFLADGAAPMGAATHLLEEKIFCFDSMDGDTSWSFLADEAGGYQHLVEESLGIAEVGFLWMILIALESLELQDSAQGNRGRGVSVADALDMIDEILAERYYMCFAADEVMAADESRMGNVYFFLASDIAMLSDDAITILSIDEKALEEFNASDVAVPIGSFTSLASESLTFSDVDSLIQGLIIEEGIALGDVELSKWVFNVLVASGCDIADIIT